MILVQNWGANVVAIRFSPDDISLTTDSTASCLWCTSLYCYLIQLDKRQYCLGYVNRLGPYKALVRFSGRH